MKHPADSIQATVQRVAVPAPPDGLQYLAAAVLEAHSSPELRTALQLAGHVHSRHAQRRGVLHRQAEQLRTQLDHIERQLAG